MQSATTQDESPRYSENKKYNIETEQMDFWHQPEHPFDRDQNKMIQMTMKLYLYCSSIQDLNIISIVKKTRSLNAMPLNNLVTLFVI